MHSSTLKDIHPIFILIGADQVARWQAPINFSISGQASALHMNGFYVAAVVVCMIFVSSLVLLPFANADWTMFRADPSRSGVGTGSPALTPSLLWKYTAGSWVVSSSAVVNGVVYIGSDDHSVYALNATNGIQLWNYTAVGAIESSLVLSTA